MGNIVKDGMMGQRKYLNIMYFNARSIRNKMDELRILASDKKPDIIAIVESWLVEENNDLGFGVENYNFIRKDRRRDLKSMGGGIIIYYKKELSIVDTTREYNVNIDYVWFKVMIKGGRTMVIGVFYRPPDSNDDEEKFLLEKISMNKTKNTVLIGDFNYRDINWKRNKSKKEGKHFLKACTELSLHQCVKEKTRGKNILDLVLVYEKNLIYRINQMAPLAKSDHDIVNITLNVMIKTNNTKVKCYSYNKADYGILENSLNGVDWEHEIGETNSNEVWNRMKCCLIKFKEENIKQFSRDTSAQVPWLNAKLRTLIKKRNNLFKRYKKNNQSYSRMKYIMIRNLVTKRIRMEKRKYELNIIKRSRRNRKVFYKYVSSINGKKSFSRIGPLIDQGGITLVDDKDVAVLLNNFLCRFLQRKIRTVVMWLIKQLGMV